MRLRIFLLFWFLVLALPACHPAPSIPPAVALRSVIVAWQIDQHLVWEIEWPAIPSGGPLVIETWRIGDRYRFEILEATAPALIGETLVYDGQTAWRYNRFDSTQATIAETPWLAPASEVFALVEQTLTHAPQTATQTTVELSHGPAQQVTIGFETGEALQVWIDQATGLPVRLRLSTGTAEVKLEAREFEPLTNPSPALFRPSLENTVNSVQ